MGGRPKQYHIEERAVKRKAYVLSFIFLIIIPSICVATRRFVVITSLYNEMHQQRMNEYKKCIEKNVKHPLIDSVHVVYDTSKDNTNPQKNELHLFLRSKDVAITYCKGHPTYGFCFQLAQELYPDHTIIVCNADIYFNETLAKLVDYDLTGKFLTLTRWDERSNGKFIPYRRVGKRDTIDSQDAWIFELPLPTFEKDDIKIGTPRCDNRIAYQANKAGLRVFNPCKTIQCIHVHRSRKRNYNMRKDRKKVLAEPILLVRWSALR